MAPCRETVLLDPLAGWAARLICLSSFGTFWESAFYRFCISISSIVFVLIFHWFRQWSLCRFQNCLVKFSLPHSTCDTLKFDDLYEKLTHYPPLGGSCFCLFSFIVSVSVCLSDFDGFGCRFWYPFGTISFSKTTRFLVLISKCVYLRTLSQNVFKKKPRITSKTTLLAPKLHQLSRKFLLNRWRCGCISSALLNQCFESLGLRTNWQGRPNMFK